MRGHLCGDGGYRSTFFRNIEFTHLRSSARFLHLTNDLGSKIDLYVRHDYVRAIEC